MYTFFFSYKAIVPVHENLILIAQQLYTDSNVNNITSYDKDVLAM